MRNRVAGIALSPDESILLRLSLLTVFLLFWASVPSACLTPAQERVLDSAMVLLVNQQYDAAEDVLARLEAEATAKPAIIYQRLAVKQTRILDYESYQFEGKAFLASADSAIALLEAHLPQATGQDSTECLFYLGNALGGKGVICGKTGNWLTAVRYAMRSKELLAEVVARDSGFHAAHLGIGVFDYYLGRGLKWVPFVAGRSTEGMREIEQATRARFPYDIAAKNTLCWILVERDRWQRADSLCQSVLAMMPDNTIFVKISALVSLWTQRYEEALERGRKLVELSSGRTPPNWNDILTGYRVQVDALEALGRTRECLGTAQEALGLSVPRQYAQIPYVKEHQSRIREVARQAEGRK